MHWTVPKMLFRYLFMPLAISANLALAQPHCESDQDVKALCIRPSKTNPDIRKYDDDHWILVPASAKSVKPPLLVFLPGTGGTPPGPNRFLRTAAEMGYRVISLAYNDEPAIAVYCPKVPDPNCSQNFRQMRWFGDVFQVDESIQNSRAESISKRLISLLAYLSKEYPADNWNQYLVAGDLDWPRIAFTGQSQGAGMAAYIGKQRAIARVILFSSPWDFYKDQEGRNQPAPWLSLPSATPLNRWFGGYHARENTARMLATAYERLAIPTGHIRVFNDELPDTGRAPSGNNPYHGQGIRNPDYQADWKFFLSPID